MEKPLRSAGQRAPHRYPSPTSAVPGDKLAVLNPGRNAMTFRARWMALSLGIILTSHLPALSQNQAGSAIAPSAEVTADYPRDRAGILIQGSEWMPITVQGPSRTRAKHAWQRCPVEQAEDCLPSKCMGSRRTTLEPRWNLMRSPPPSSRGLHIQFQSNFNVL